MKLSDESHQNEKRRVDEFLKLSVFAKETRRQGEENMNMKKRKNEIKIPCVEKILLRYMENVLRECVEFVIPFKY